MIVVGLDASLARRPDTVHRKRLAFGSACVRSDLDRPVPHRVGEVPLRGRIRVGRVERLKQVAGKEAFPLHVGQLVDPLAVGLGPPCLGLEGLVRLAQVKRSVEAVKEQRPLIVVLMDDIPVLQAARCNELIAEADRAVDVVEPAYHVAKDGEACADRDLHRAHLRRRGASVVANLRVHGAGTDKHNRQGGGHSHRSSSSRDDTHNKLA